MMELTDLEICKKIAEVEGVKLRNLQVIKYKLTAIPPKYNEYNPLKDDSLCFQLMVKYEINLSYDFKGCSNRYVCFHNKIIATELSRESTPNRAVCMAVIKASKGVNNE